MERGEELGPFYTIREAAKAIRLTIELQEKVDQLYARVD